MNLFVVEDDEDARALLSELLSGEGATVATASNVEEALPQLRARCPDVLLSDIGLPDIDGFEFIRRVRQLYPPEKLPAIAFTAYAQSQDRDKIRKAGFQAHLAKPAVPSEVVRLVSKVARERSR
jgi:CheY-like chemotaxis protein